MIINAIHEYTTYSTAKFLTKENLLILHENIDHLASGQSDLYKPIRSKMETPLTSPSLRHFVWNIGERLGISLSERANFIKTIFPNELKMQPWDTLSRISKIPYTVRFLLTVQNMMILNLIILL